MCKTDCVLATLDKKNYNIIEGNARKRKRNEEINFLKNFRIFRQLTKAKLSQILLIMQEKTFTRNYIIFNEGDPISGVYFIKQGEFEISKKSKSEINESKPKQI